MSTKHRNNRNKVKAAIQGKTGMVSIRPLPEYVLADAFKYHPGDLIASKHYIRCN